jgi:hypothetical protein
VSSTNANEKNARPPIAPVKDIKIGRTLLQSSQIFRELKSLSIPVGLSSTAPRTRKYETVSSTIQPNQMAKFRREMPMSTGGGSWLGAFLQTFQA